MWLQVKLQTTKSSLIKHEKVVHAGEKLKLPCENCAYEATSKGKLLEHTKVMHKEVKYPCKDCDHKANSKNALSKGYS